MSDYELSRWRIRMAWRGTIKPWVQFLAFLPLAAGWLIWVQVVELGRRAIRWCRSGGK